MKNLEPLTGTSAPSGGLRLGIGASLRKRMFQTERPEGDRLQLLP
jgi:hypothetical protein